MRLGPFNDVHVFDKAGSIGVASCGATLAIRDTRACRARARRNNAAARPIIDSPSGPPRAWATIPYANWAQTWEDIQAARAVGDGP